MFNFRPSASQRLYYSPPAHSVYPNDFLYPSSHSPVIDAEFRYCRAISEYLAAEEEYDAMIRAREKAALEARAEARRQERARLLGVRIARAREEQQQWQLKRALLAEAFSRTAVSADDGPSRPHIIPIQRGVPGRTLSDTLLVAPRLYAHARRSLGAVACSEKKKSLVCDSVPQPPVEKKVQPQGAAGGSVHVNQPLHPHFFRALEPDDRSVPDSESVLRERLQKIAGDEEVQDLARSLLRHLTSTSTSGIGRPSAAASSPEINRTQTPEGADLSRSDALHGTAAEVAKASFKAHRAEAAEKDERAGPSAAAKTSPSSLTVIQNICSALAKLSAGFALPSSLDFSDDEPDGLAYTPTNAPVRAYEHALDELLAQLDAVETDGEEVRMLRRAAVKEVEKAIEDVERKVREVREDAKPGNSAGAAISAEANVAKDKDILDVAHSELLLDDNDTKPKAEESSPSISDGRLDSDSSMPEAVSLPVSPHDATPLEECRAPVSESVLEVAAVATPTLAAADQGDGFLISADDDPEAKHEVAPVVGTTDQTTTVPVRSDPSRVTTPLESPAGVSTPILGAIAPSSTPVSPALSSSSIDSEDVFSFALLGHDQYSALARPEGENETADDDDDREWTEIEA